MVTRPEQITDKNGKLTTVHKKVVDVTNEKSRTVPSAPQRSQTPEETEDRRWAESPYRLSIAKDLFNENDAVHEDWESLPDSLKESYLELANNERGAMEELLDSVDYYVPASRDQMTKAISTIISSESDAVGTIRAFDTIAMDIDANVENGMNLQAAYIATRDKLYPVWIDGYKRCFDKLEALAPEIN